MATVTMQYGTELRDTPVVAFLSAFDETNRRGVYNRVAQALWTLVRRHFRKIEPSHHKTAESTPCTLIPVLLLPFFILFLRDENGFARA